MAARPALRSVGDGYLLVDKPAGPSTYDLIRWTKRSLGRIRIGHSGTLDPIASGLVILLIGKATKSQMSFMKLDKRYRFRVRLGIKTDSGDIAGRIIAQSEPPDMSEDAIREAAATLRGAQEQRPPMYSAVKVSGQPLYKLARRGETVERKARPITVHDLAFEGRHGNDVAFAATVSSGTYIRVLAEDIAAALKTVGTVSFLRRETVGPYSLADALPGERLTALDEATLPTILRPVDPHV